MKKFCWVMLYLIALPVWAGEETSLWVSADRQGQRLLEQGKPAEAARTFSDPRRRAYAQLLAGDYRAASKGFAAFDDAEAHYNRGNALAHVGDLQEALQAYEAALSRDANHRDARHNRDVIAKVLKQQSLPSSSDQGSGEKNNKAEDKGTAGQNKPSGHSSHDSSQSPDSNVQANDLPSKPSSENIVTDRAKSSALKQAGKETANSQSTKKTEQENLRQEDGLHESVQPPKTEHDLALDQWLRRIPEDPGGLLKRKFLIEHLIKERKAQQ